MRTPAFISFHANHCGNDDTLMLRASILQQIPQSKISCPPSILDKLHVVSKLLQATKFTLAIIFINGKKHASTIMRHLTQLHFATCVVNADLSQRQRERNVAQIQAGKVGVVIATDLLARGVDFEGCDLVVHLDIPCDTATYLHRVDRAGRFGRKGSSVVVFNPGKEGKQLNILEDSLGFRLIDSEQSEPNASLVDAPDARHTTRAHVKRENENAIDCTQRRATAERQSQCGSSRKRKVAAVHMAARKQPPHKATTTAARAVDEQMEATTTKCDNHVPTQFAPIPPAKRAKRTPPSHVICEEENQMHHVASSDHKMQAVNKESRPSSPAPQSQADGTHAHNMDHEWDTYAQEAFDAGYQHAYEQAYQIACELRERLSSDPS